MPKIPKIPFRHMHKGFISRAAHNVSYYKKWHHKYADCFLCLLYDCDDVGYRQKHFRKSNYA